MSLRVWYAGEMVTAVECTRVALDWGVVSLEMAGLVPLRLRLRMCLQIARWTQKVRGGRKRTQMEMTLCWVRGMMWQMGGPTV